MGLLGFHWECNGTIAISWALWEIFYAGFAAGFQLTSSVITSVAAKMPKMNIGNNNQHTHTCKDDSNYIYEYIWIGHIVFQLATFDYRRLFDIIWPLFFVLPTEQKFSIFFAEWYLGLKMEVMVMVSPPLSCWTKLLYWFNLSPWKPWPEMTWPFSHEIFTFLNHRDVTWCHRYGIGWLTVNHSPRLASPSGHIPHRFAKATCYHLPIDQIRQKSASTEA